MNFDTVSAGFDIIFMFPPSLIHYMYMCIIRSAVSKHRNNWTEVTSIVCRSQVRVWNVALVSSNQYLSYGYQCSIWQSDTCTSCKWTISNIRHVSLKIDNKLFTWLVVSTILKIISLYGSVRKVGWVKGIAITLCWLLQAFTLSACVKASMSWMVTQSKSLGCASML